MFIITLAILSGDIRIPGDDGTDGKEHTQKEADLSEPGPQEDVLDAATDEIHHSISSLFQLTAIIQNLSSRDWLERNEKIDMSCFEFFDINHVRDKFKLTQDGDYLIERLGKANTKRRQLLHDKMVGRR